MSGSHAKPVVAVLSSPSDHPWPGLEPLEGEAEIVQVCTEKDLTEALSRAEILVVTDFNTDFISHAWPRAKHLKWIHATSAGVDAILIPEIVESEIPLTNARGVFDRGIAEFVLGLVIMFAKDLHGSLALKREHRWKHRDSEPVKGRKVLVYGAGSIGREIAKLLSAAGLRVEGMARSARESDEDFEVIHAAEHLDARLAHADFVVIAAPLTEQTRGAFGAAQFKAMQPHARLINIGRGEIVRTDELVEALENEEIAGAALDVFEEEPLPRGHPLWDMPQVFISAHMAGDLVGWRSALSEQFIVNFHRWKRGDPLNNVVDKEKGYGALS